MRGRLILEQFSPDQITTKGSKSIVSHALTRFDKIDDRNNKNNINKVEPYLQSLCLNFVL